MGVLSVCVATKSSFAGFMVTNLLRDCSIKPDNIFYNNLITISARCGKSDEAFNLLKEMKSQGINPCVIAYTAVICSCSEEINQSLTLVKRRRQLVLLERAFAILQEMQEKHIKTDLVVYNSLLLACSRAREIQRLKDVYWLMQSNGHTPESSTYGILVEALSKNGLPHEALNIYYKSIEEGKSDSVKLMSAALDACCKIGCLGKSKIRELWEQMRIRGLKPNAKLISTLIRVAGRIGELEYVSLLIANNDEKNIELNHVHQTYLIKAYVQDGKKDLAFDIFDQLSKNNSVISLLQTKKYSAQLIDGMNALINVYAYEKFIERIYQLLKRVTKMDLNLNEYTYSAVIKTYFKCKKSELAFDLYKTLHDNGVKIDEVVVKNILKLCQKQSNLMRVMLEKKQKIVKRDIFGNRILELLGGKRSTPMSQNKWKDFVINIYRESIHIGIKPNIQIFNLTISCLRKSASYNPILRESLIDNYKVKKKINKLIDSPILKALDYDEEGSWDPRALQLVNEAIHNSILKPFKVRKNGPQTIDFRLLPPQTAELYLMYILDQIRLFILYTYHRKKPCLSFTLYVQPFNPNAVFTVSGRLSPIPDKVIEPILEKDKGSAHGLGIAAMLRRLRLRYFAIPKEGLIVLDSYDVNSWITTVLQKATHSIK